MGMLTVKLRARNLLRFNGVRESIAAVRTAVEASATNESGIRQIVQAHMLDLISGKDPRPEMLASLIYRVLLEPNPPATIGDHLSVGSDYGVSIVPDATCPEGCRVVVEHKLRGLAEAAAD